MDQDYRLSYWRFTFIGICNYFHRVTQRSKGDVENIDKYGFQLTNENMNRHLKKSEHVHEEYLLLIKSVCAPHDNSTRSKC